MKMTKPELAEYSKFTQKYIEVFDEYQGYKQEVAELNQANQIVPGNIMIPLRKYENMVMDMVTKAYHMWNKGHSDLYTDGWKFWMKEDTELRKKRYGLLLTGWLDITCKDCNHSEEGDYPEGVLYCPDCGSSNIEVDEGIHPFD